jgi:hypothetical protein
MPSENSDKYFKLQFQFTRTYGKPSDASSWETENISWNTTMFLILDRITHVI